MYALFQRKSSPAEHVALLEKIKAEIKCFNSDSDVQRYEELGRLKDYLEYRICTREYEAKLAAAHGNVAGLRSQYVKSVMDAFDDAEKSRAEEKLWGWSPLYLIFKEWPLPNFRKSPWAHTEAEWVELEKTLLENVSTEPLSLDFECPHILRAFLVLVRTLHRHTRPLAHPEVGLTLKYILEFATDNHNSVALTNVVHSLSSTGWALFPDIHTVADTLSNLHSDTVALLGYHPEKQFGVVQKIKSFIGRIAHRAVSDLVRMHRTSEVRDMWFAADVPEQRRAKCHEVRSYHVYFVLSPNFSLFNFRSLCLCLAYPDLLNSHSGTVFRNAHS